MIMATDLLNNRIKDIMCKRGQAGLDPTPTLADIERTHILFVNAHYKPFAAIGYEYTKVRYNSGSASFSTPVTFSIPAYGEFFSDMVVNVTLAQTAATVGAVPPLPAHIGVNDQATEVVGPITVAQTSGLEGVATHTYTHYRQEYVDDAGNVLGVGVPAQNFVRYCEFPGQALFTRVKFDVNGNPLDEYTQEAMMFHQKFRVLEDKLLGWKKLVGQEVPVDAYSQLSAISGANKFMAPMADLDDITGGPAPGAPVSASITARKVFQVVSGPQTPKAIQPALDLWIPLIFWFNRDVRLAMPSISIPYGQRYITIYLESQANMLSVAPGNLFLRVTTEVRLDNEVGGATGTVAALAVYSITRSVSYTPVLAVGSVIDTTQTVTNMEMYINNIFVNPEIHDIYIRRIGFSLIRVHRLQSQRLAVSTDEILLSQLKWPTETIYLGMRPAVNIAAANVNRYRDWHRLTLVTDETMQTVSHKIDRFCTDDALAFNAANLAGAAEHKEITCSWTDEQLFVPVYTETIDTLKVTVQGNTIIDEYRAPFFNVYTPWYYGNGTIRSPSDAGAMMINFCLYPGTYQPSGHLNISRAREFYIRYTSSYCGSPTPCDFLGLAIAINFLLISDGTAVLRYTT